MRRYCSVLRTHTLAQMCLWWLQSLKLTPTVGIWPRCFSPTSKADSLPVVLGDARYWGLHDMSMHITENIGAIREICLMESQALGRASPSCELGTTCQRLLVASLAISVDQPGNADLEEDPLLSQHTLDTLQQTVASGARATFLCFSLSFDCRFSFSRRRGRQEPGMTYDHIFVLKTRVEPRPWHEV